jgi:hypothetical protein
MKKQHSKDEYKAIGIRLLFIVLYCIVAYIAAFVVLLIAVFQSISTLLIKSPNLHLLNFSQSLGIYIFQIISFITFDTEEMPFPFKPWPEKLEIDKSHRKHH